MNKFVNISLFLLLCSLFCACEDEETIDPSTALNKWRVKEIKGHNELWGDFTMSLDYITDFLNLGIVYNNQHDTIATLANGRVQMMLPAITQEEIDALEPGEEIPMENRIIYSVYRDTCELTVSHYRPDDLSFTFDYGENFLFEYDDPFGLNPKMLKWRKIYEWADASVEQPMERMVYTYDGDRIRQGELAVYENEWKVKELWKYAYSGEQLASLKVVQVDGKELWSKTFAYSGNQIVVTFAAERTTQKTTYTLNVDGYVTRIDEGNGNYMDIKYEAGHGNFSDFTPEVRRLEGEPYIK